jgi:hypothetical protein
LGALFALTPLTAVFAGLFAFAGLTCAFGGVPTMDGVFGDSCGVVSSGVVSCGVVACGVVACGVVAGGVFDPDGVVSCGVVCCGVVSVGVVSVGVVTVGVVSVGVVSDGVVSVGVVSVSFLQWSSFTPPLLPCSSQSWPLSDGSLLQSLPVDPCEQSPWPGGCPFPAVAMPETAKPRTPTTSARTNVKRCFFTGILPFGCLFDPPHPER